LKFQHTAYSWSYALSHAQKETIEKWATDQIREAYEHQDVFVEMDDYGTHIGIKIVVAGTLIPKEDFQG
jgi:hypothetical protein